MSHREFWASILACSVVAVAPNAARAQDLSAGEKVFNKCKACHQLGEKAKNRVGPHLNGIVGQQAAVVEGYKYSASLSKSGLVWDEATLAAFLAEPKAIVPSTKMSFAGLRTQEDISAVIAFLASYNADGTRK